MDTELLTPEQVAERLGIHTQTLKEWRLQGKGPQAVYLSPRLIRYRPEVVEQWIESLQPESESN